MTESLVPFSFDGRAVRVLVRDGDPWFVAADVCRALEIGNPSDAIRRLDADERTLVSIEGGPPGGTNLVSEAGLFSLVLGSRKAEAKAFKRWVTHDVLPSIRRTGAFAAPTVDPIAMLSDPSTLRALLGNYAERVQSLEATVQVQAPKVEVYDRIVATDDTFGIRESVKLLRESTGVTERELVALMVRRGWIQRLGKRLGPAYEGERRGYVTSRITEWTDTLTGTAHQKPELRITGKGIARLTELLTSEAA